MPTMSNRIFFSLVAALLCLTVTSVCSYGPYVEEYGPREESLRQVRRCPTCPADCPESLASPWYGSPTVYGQPGPFYKATNENVKGLPQQASYSASQPHPRDSVGPVFYGNPHYINPYENSRCRCSHGRCNARSPRSGNASPEPVITVPPTKHEQVPFDSMESRGLSPYGYPRFSAASFVPETYQEIDSFGVIPTENHRVSRHYGHAYKQMISDRTIDQEESSGSNPSNWNPSDLSLPQQPERTMYDGRLKAVETPARKKVFVVYRADADHTIDDDDLDRSLIPTSRQQQQQQHHHDGSTGSSSTDDSTSAPPNNPMSDFQLEQVVRRAIAAAARQNTREEELYSRNQHTREIDYNEHQRNPEESYNTAARPYNDDLYRRFNAEEAIDRQEKRKQYIAAFPPSELVYTPTMRHYNPYVLPEDYSQNIPSQSISEQGNHQRYNAAWEAQQIADKALNVAAEDIGEYTSQIGQQQQQQQPTTILEELREISRQQQEQEEEKDENNEQKEKKSFETVQDLMPNKRETDLEALLPPPINYRTHSRTTDSTSYPGGKANEQVESAPQRDKGNRMLEIMTEKEENGPPIAINPDLIEDMEIPPIEGSEVELQLSFESSDNTTPSPTN